MEHILLQGNPEMALRERDEVVETLPADAANQSFAMSIRLRSPDSRFQNPHAKAFQSFGRRIFKNASRS